MTKNIKAFLFPCLWLIQMSLGHAVNLPDDLRFICENEGIMQPDKKAAWYGKLRNTPGITDRLVDLLWECYREPDDILRNVIHALMQRSDISDEQLKKITIELTHLAKQGPISQLDSDKRNFFSVICLLRRKPTAENEGLALILLASDDSLVRSIAASTLGWIGTRRSIEPMRKHFDTFRYIDTDPPSRKPQVFPAEEMLLARVAGKTAPSGDSTLPTTIKNLTASESMKARPATEHASESTQWLGWIIVIFSAMGCSWLLLKRRP